MEFIILTVTTCFGVHNHRHNAPFLAGIMAFVSWTCFPGAETILNFALQTASIRVLTCKLLCYSTSSMVFVPAVHILKRTPYFHCLQIDFT